MKRKKIIISLLIIILAPVCFSEPLLNIGRVKYGGGGDWYSDKTSLPNVIDFIKKHKIAKVGKEITVELTKSSLYSTPFIYLTGHGMIKFSKEESIVLRNYLINGGFLYIDDNFGLDKYIRREMKKVFPEKSFTQVPYSHKIFRSFFKFKHGLPKIHEHYGGPPIAFSIEYNNRMVVFYSFNTDIGDGTEDFWVHKVPEPKRQSALKMFSNVIVYSLKN